MLRIKLFSVAKRKRMRLNAKLEKNRLMPNTSDMPGNTTGRANMSSRELSADFGGPMRKGPKIIVPVIRSDGTLSGKIAFITAYCDEIHPKQVYRCRLAGLSIARIADILLVDPKLIRDWRKKYPKMAKAWADGGAHADAYVATAMFKRAIGYSHKTEKIAINSQTGKVTRAVFRERYAPDTAAGTFWLTNRQPGLWKNRNQSELVGKDGERLEVPSIMINPVMSANQLAEIETIDGTAEEIKDAEYPSDTVDE